ncbi:MAG TPA: phage tail sheath subtilisin-like domain-containing protein, partial [Sphingomicrobium sp.]|nr:phage tail sheath subtilisin-like domain-containing protein [Sphingomicrobium sp.]
MPADLTRPNVEVGEDSTAVTPIADAQTSVFALVGLTADGPVNQPVKVSSVEDFVQTFGSTSPFEDLSRPVAQYFANGGTSAWIVSAGTSEAGTDIDLIGSASDRSGMFALDAISFNLLSLPPATSPAAHQAIAQYAEQRRAFAILDLPTDTRSIADAQAWAAAAPKSANAAAYFPRLVSSAGSNGTTSVAGTNSAAIAGVYARTDATRGIWKAPAGLMATIQGCAGVELSLDDQETGMLDPLGLNVIRSFPAGMCVWGARTLAGDDSLASTWKYVPVRRTALFIEVSLLAGLQWTVFETNGDQLWATVRSQVQAFMHGLFKQGAFQGLTPSDAYFVDCRGDPAASPVASLTVGFAPTKPAEFVTIE